MAPIDARSDFEKYIECPLCFELLEEPRELPCTHLMCERCIAKFGVNNNIKCPECLSENNVPDIELLPVPKHFKAAIKAWCSLNITTEDFVVCKTCYSANMGRAIQGTLDHAQMTSTCAICERHPGKYGTTLCYDCQQKFAKSYHDTAILNHNVCTTCGTTVDPMKKIFCYHCDPTFNQDTTNEASQVHCYRCDKVLLATDARCSECCEYCDQEQECNYEQQDVEETDENIAPPLPSIFVERTRQSGANSVATSAIGSTKNKFHYAPGDVYLKDCSAASLLGTQWIDDHAMRFSLSYYLNTLAGAYLHQICLLSPNDVQLLTHNRTIPLLEVAEVQQWNNRDLFLFPLNHNPNPEKQGGLHWSLLVYHASQEEWYHYDSSYKAHESLAYKAATTFLGLLGMTDYPNIQTGNKQVFQTNGYDCGAYTIGFGKAVLCAYHPDEKLRVSLASITPNAITRERCFLHKLLQEYRI